LTETGAGMMPILGSVSCAFAEIERLKIKRTGRRRFLNMI